MGIGCLWEIVCSLHSAWKNGELFSPPTLSSTAVRPLFSSQWQDVRMGGTGEEQERDL